MLHRYNKKIRKLINIKKEFSSTLLTFIDNETEEKENFQILLDYLEAYQGRQEELELIFNIILNLSNNHHRHSNFFPKIEQILLCLEEGIKNFFTNLEIFNFFGSNKRIILFLIQKEIIEFDENINKLIIEKYSGKDPKYYYFFIPELEKFNEKETIDKIKNELFEDNPEILNNYEEKRQKGENDSYLASLIQNDSIVDFISHTTRTNLCLSSQIKPSIFETNAFLIGKEPTLIEYATFFGSIQIFQYLRLNNVELTPSLWLYAIHSDNAEIIHLLEENHIQPNDEYYQTCFLESIKCHHNNIANYIENNLLVKQKGFKCNDELDWEEKLVHCSLKYSNYFYFPMDFSKSFAFFYLGKYKYNTIVNFYLKANEKEIIEEVILTNKKIFLMKLQTKNILNSVSYTKSIFF